MMASAAVEIGDWSSIGSALTAARRRLAESETPDLDAQVLLMQVLEVERAFLFTHDDYELSGAQQEALVVAVNRRAAGEPIAYITGSKGFYDLELEVSPAVLIPRPETELLLEEALRLTADEEAITVADIGTGSGAIAIGFARQRTRSRVYATDVSEDALDVARRNARRYRVDVEFMRGELAEPLRQRGIKLDLLLANLPYIRSDDLRDLAVSRYEPWLALDGGADGLRCIEALLGQTAAVCRPGARVLLEIGADQGEAVRALIRRRLSVDCVISKDYARLDRIASFRLC